MPAQPGFRSKCAVSIRGGPFSGVSAATLERRARKMLAAHGLDTVELSVAVVDDDSMADLNQTYRNKEGPTDVLAFALREGEPPPLVDGQLEPLGDIIISAPTARRQAEAARRPLLDEMTMLLAHGLLHLVGYDHQTDEEEREMNAAAAILEAAARRRGSSSG
ncbi:MAG: rRNA maturation RNase YbeY [Myxococcota bacterium]